MINNDYTQREIWTPGSESEWVGIDGPVIVSICEQMRCKNNGD